MIIVRLLSPEPFWLVRHHQSLPGSREPTLSWNQLRSLTWEKANRRRKLVLTPDYVNKFRFECRCKQTCGKTARSYPAARMSLLSKLRGTRARIVVPPSGSDSTENVPFT